MNKEFEVNGVQYIAVSLPETAKNIENDDRVLMYDYMENGFERMKAELLPATDGTWEIVGLVRELFNDNCRKIFSSHTVWYSTESGTTVEGTIPIDHIETPLMKFDKLRKDHNLNDNSLIIKKI